MNRGRFWLTAAAAALVIAAAAAWLFPYGALGLDSEADRQRGFLLTLWTFGVLAICFGSSGLLGAIAPLGFRDVAEHGSIQAALEAKQEAARQGGSAFYNFAGWLVTAGAGLIVIYFVAWLSLGA